MANKDLIRYDLLVQDALKGVVRRVLIDAGKEGLPGEHHFYISFRTDYAGVKISNRLREKYPQEMTIVMQHQFWDLVITEQAFEVGMSFSGVPEKLVIPFDSLTGFFDPSVQFGLKFDSNEDEEDEENVPQPAPESREGAEPIALKPSRKTDQDAKEPSEKKPRSPAPKTDKAPKAGEPGEAEPAAGSDAGGTAQVVSLDAFRKKN